MPMVGLSFTADLLGWFLAFLLPAFVMVGPIRRDRGAARAYLLVVLLHAAAAAIYVYLPGILPSRGDTQVFHKYAVLRQSTLEGSFSIGSGFFREYLAQVYSLVGPSFFLGAVLSIWAFAISVAVLVRLMEILDVRQGKGLVVLLFGALPTSVLYGTVPMREPYQVLFFMLACYSMLRFRLTSHPHHLVAAIVFALLMGLLHKGLIVYAPFLILVMLLVRVDHPRAPSTSRGRMYLHRFAAVALAIGFVMWMSGAVYKLEGVGGAEVLVTATTGEGLIEFATEHRDDEALSKGRTAYGVALDTSTPFRFVYSAVMIFFYYMFTPFPWQVRNLMDIYAFGEVILRIVTLIAIVRMWRRKGPIDRHMVTLLMIVYLSVAFLWAAGTTNYGTATRHHMVHQWLLLLLGVPALLQSRLGIVRGRLPTGQRITATQPPTGPATRLSPRMPHLRPLVDASWPPPRLAVETQGPKGLRSAGVGFRMWSGSPAHRRRLDDR